MSETNGKDGVVVARRYLVNGRVQGVGFRWFVQKSATALGVCGWTKNLDDGRVEVYALGTPEQLNELSSHLWRGPERSSVRGLEEQEAAPEAVSNFRIRH